MAKDHRIPLAFGLYCVTCLAIFLLGSNDEARLHRPFLEPNPQDVPEPAQAAKFFTSRLTVRVRIDREMTFREFIRINQLERLRERLEALNGWRDNHVLHAGDEITVPLSPESHGLEPANR